jgi:hypothetical protein
MENPNPKDEAAAAAVNGLVVNKNDADFTEEEKQRIEQALAENQKKNQTFLITGERGTTKQVVKEQVQEGFTVYFKDCHDGDYTVTAPCTKVLVERCTNFKLHLGAQIKTETLEVWRCEDAHIQINTSIKTLQADLSKRLSLSFSKKENYGSVVWSGVYDLTLAVGEGDSRDLHQSGYEQMKEKFPDINDQFDQFIIRYINGSLLSEQVVRLPNGFPTTEREANEFDEKQKANEAAREEYIRNMVKWAAPKLGIKDYRKRPKVGRNEPCPCKSGKKFKACCWNKYEK